MKAPLTTLLPLVLILAACSPPPEQPALLTYGTGTPACILFCTSSAVFADLAESAQINTVLGKQEEVALP